MQTQRPSHRELTNKIRLAKEAVGENRIALVEPDIIAADALELGYLIQDISEVLSLVLKEITPHDYTGSRPPQKSYEDKIRGTELFAFRWESKRFGCETYLKFALKDDQIWLVSLHSHREGKGE